MKIKKGDILVGKNKINGERIFLEYLGKTDKSKDPMLYNSGFTRHVLELGENREMYISDSWAKEHELKLYQKNGKNM